MLKRFNLSVCVLIGLLTASQMSSAQTTPWNGSWKLDPASLTYEGPTVSVTTDAEGFVNTREGVSQPKVVCDGTAKPSTDGVMLTCNKQNDGYAIAATKDGKPTRYTTITLSADGTTRTANSKLFPESGEPYTVTSISERVSGGPGLAGEWKEVKFSSTDDTGVLTIAVHGDSVDFKETDTPKPITCKLDGTDTKISATQSISILLADANTLKVTYKDGEGKARRENTFVLSKDGSSITETDVTPSPSKSTMSVVLRKM
jgi:hypothetical protein